jgi:hypothetical protein
MVVVHHKDRCALRCDENVRKLTFLRSTAAALRSSMVFSEVLRFLRRVSGTKICSAVGVVLRNQPSVPHYIK